MTRNIDPLVPDVLQPGLAVVFCGTALGRESFRQRAYYAHPGNRFWRTLHNVGLTPYQILPKEYPIVTRFGIGLTDVCKTSYGNDIDILAPQFDPLATRPTARRIRFPRVKLARMVRADRRFATSNRHSVAKSNREMLSA